MSVGGPPPLPSLPLPGPTDHLAGPIPSIGILVDGGSTGQVIGEDITTANQIQLNQVGIYLEGGRDHVVRGQNIIQNFTAGIIAHGGQKYQLGGFTPKNGNHL
ncbi:MAG: hypothetical protein EXS36_17505 [Pedosphaera sp.]|nr:hypothetical protein [Pedosphaera sp.]